MIFIYFSGVDGLIVRKISGGDDEGLIVLLMKIGGGSDRYARQRMGKRE